MALRRAMVTLRRSILPSPGEPGLIPLTRGYSAALATPATRVRVRSVTNSSAAVG